MRFRLCMIMVAMLLASAVNAQRKRAFLVGISHYDTALTGYQWNNINGVEDVNLLTPALRKQGFATMTLLDEQATFDNIVSQITQFTNKTKKGDIVYLHFSTHGQPVEDLNGDEEDGWDESIVPIDAYKIYRKGSYEGQKHLTDDLLNKYIKNSVKRLDRQDSCMSLLMPAMLARRQEPTTKQFEVPTWASHIIIRYSSLLQVKSLIIGLRHQSNIPTFCILRPAVQTK